MPSQQSDSDGLLTCRQCDVRYAWASDWLDLQAENDRLREAMREARALLHEVRPQSMRAAAVLGKALDPIADLDPMAHGEVAEMARRRTIAKTGESS